MPEGLEAEIWRRACERLVGRTLCDVWVDERVADDGFVDATTGRSVESIRRRGKIVLIDTDGPSIGLHFGMTGRVEVDGHAPIDRLEYASGADRSEWDRLRISTQPAVGTGPALRMNDPRRLGRVTLDPDTSRLGPDAGTVTAVELGAAFEGRRAAVKTLLLDQAVVAGLGNLCADEILFWSGISPHRHVDSLTADDTDTMARTCRERLASMLAAGGSTTGTLEPGLRSGGALCPLDSAPLARSTIGGRTAVWCPVHQR